MKMSWEESILNVLIWVGIGLGELIVALVINSRLILPAMFNFDEVEEIENENEGVINLLTVNTIALTAAITILISSSIIYAQDALTEVIVFFICLGIIYGLIILTCRVIVPAMTSLDEVKMLKDNKKASVIFSAINAVIIIGISVIFATALLT